MFLSSQFALGLFTITFSIYLEFEMNWSLYILLRLNDGKVCRTMDQIKKHCS